MYKERGASWAWERKDLATAIATTGRTGFGRMAEG
jgi:hypothetical protein